MRYVSTIYYTQIYVDIIIRKFLPIKFFYLYRIYISKKKYI